MSRFMFYVTAMFYALCALQFSSAAPLPRHSLSARGPPLPPFLAPLTDSGSLGAGAPAYTNWLQILRGNSGDILRRLSNDPSLPARQETSARRDADSPVITSMNGIPIGHGISSFGAGAPIFNGGLFSHMWRRSHEVSLTD
ncbi:hypothetical protein PHLGIDRAFT_20666 [Phlebiopsis gigantea 11061_1 CR5-6]|uniref:Uncharacterized protein n=1 Tax=Phlebiopsis gigantea (strain 11061_1 CR5-6) TaxID=745531 RepID=A0A0C3S1N6_PHLG1|nr:hypothetical protein PHLGIDRAFT_20666 [Phlebiopsis gigantea 11061_1 CR5-6]